MEWRVVVVVMVVRMRRSPSHRGSEKIFSSFYYHFVS